MKWNRARISNPERFAVFEDHLIYADGVAQMELSGVPLGSFAGSSYEERTLELMSGDLFVFCSDGVFEARDTRRREFGADRLMRLVEEAREQPARQLVDAIFDAVEAFRGEATPNDDMTAVVLKITS